MSVRITFKQGDFVRESEYHCAECAAIACDENAEVARANIAHVPEEQENDVIDFANKSVSLAYSIRAGQRYGTFTPSGQSPVEWSLTDLGSGMVKGRHVGAN